MKPRNRASIIACCWAVASSSLLAALPSSSLADEAASTQEFWVEQLAEGLNFPWSMAWLPNGEMLIVEKLGGIRVFRDGKLDPNALKGAPDAYKVAQNGLLDIAIDPDFARNQRIFLMFTEGSARANHGALFRARYTGDALVDGKVIFRTRPDSAIFPLPLAGRILFLPDKTMLLTSTDDHARRHLVRLLDNHLGKILRLDRDGAAPADNPLIGKPNTLPEIYAYGTRAPLGLARDSRNGSIWEVENGPRGGDELNLLKRGADYGWPIVTHGTWYDGTVISEKTEAPGIEPPAVYWVPSIAPSSVAISLSDNYPAWKGDLFVGALMAKHLRRVRIRNGQAVEQEELLKHLNERVRDVRQGPDGLLYVLTDNSNGRLLRLQPGKPSPTQAAREAKPPAQPQKILMGDISRPPREPNLAQGKQVYEQRCLSCHTLAGNAAGGIGPNLFGLFGRKAGSSSGHAYSKAMRDSGVTWTEQTMDYFLAAPQDYVPGTTMAAEPVVDDAQRWNLIAYLKSSGVR
jgi:glucose/arabinose dehydrogenase/cytochrome c2